MVSSTQSRHVRTDPVVEVARRGAVWLVLAGGTAMSLASGLQAITGDATGLITLLAAAPTTALAFALSRQRRPNVVLLLALIALIAFGSEVYSAWNGHTEYVAGIGSEVVVFGVGVLAVFIARERPRAVAVAFVLGTVTTAVVSQVHLNGPSLEIVTDVVVITSVMGTVTYLVIKVLDSLTESQNRYSDLASVIPIAVYELDVTRAVGHLRSGEVRHTPGSQAYGKELLEMTRLSFRNEMVDMLIRDYGNWHSFINGENAAAIRREGMRILEAVAAGERSGSGEASSRRLDGTMQHFIHRWTTGRCNSPSDPIRLVMAATDVTQLRVTEAALAEQLRERDQFVASVSHELRTPLTSVMGLTEELVSRPETFDATEQQELLGVVAAETRDVVNIVEDLLVTARAESGQLHVRLEPCDLSAEMHRVAELLGGTTLSDGSVWAEADPGRLRQVLRNLVTNAHRYGGPDIRMSVARQDGRAVFTIRDDGNALPAEAQDRIFEAYERAGDQGAVGSVGLGLHVARLLARQMGGDLTYDHDGVDTVFRLELPAAAPA